MKYELEVLKKSKALMHDVLYMAERHTDYRFTLNPQIIRAALSVGSNIAEGSRRTNKEFKRFIDIAIGSAEEVNYQISFYKGNIHHIQDTCDHIIAMLVNLKKSIK